MPQNVFTMLMFSGQAEEAVRYYAEVIPQTELLELPDCGHSPHRDQPQALITAITQFFGRHSLRA